MAAEGQELSSSEYIIHHLTHLHNEQPTGLVDLSVFNFDSMFFTTLLGVAACFFLWKAARHATSGVPGRFQAAVEMLYEWVENEGCPPLVWGVLIGGGAVTVLFTYFFGLKNETAHLMMTALYVASTRNPTTTTTSTTANRAAIEAGVIRAARRSSARGPSPRRSRGWRPAAR